MKQLSSRTGTSTGVLCILSAGALFLAGIPPVRGSDSLSVEETRDLAWNPGEDDEPREPILWLPEQMDLSGVERTKRTGRGMMGSSGVGMNGGGPSLSIVNPLDVLRQRLYLEMARRRMQVSEGQIQANREMLNNVGKRAGGGGGGGILGVATGLGDLRRRGLLLRRQTRALTADDRSEKPSGVEETSSERPPLQTVPLLAQSPHNRGQTL